MDLSTTYLGLPLAHPLMPGASPLADDLDTVRRLEDAGASAIVLRSLFEEQIEGEQSAVTNFIEGYADSYAEALSYFPHPTEFVLGPDKYLEHLAKVKHAVRVPVIASLNGHTPGGWTEYATLMADAGADAVELNVYNMATDPAQSGEEVEAGILEVVKSVKASVKIPVAVKLSPFFSALPHLAKRLDALHVDGLILFNRFYQPDIDLELLEAAPRLQLSDSGELLLRLRWLAVLSGRINASLAVSGGVHTSQDAIKAVMTGAGAVQMVSALLHHGPAYLRQVLLGVEQWLVEHEYDSLRQLQGSMSLLRCPDPRAFERGNYLRVLQGWRRETMEAGVSAPR